MACKDCIHFEMCNRTDMKDCPHFEDRSQFVKAVHGRWEKASEKMPIYRCSICKDRNLFRNGDNVFSNYCPNCGAKMDGGSHD